MFSIIFKNYATFTRRQVQSLKLQFLIWSRVTAYTVIHGLSVDRRTLRKKDYKTPKNLKRGLTEGKTKNS